MWPVFDQLPRGLILFRDDIEYTVGQLKDFLNGAPLDQREASVYASFLHFTLDGNLDY